MKVIKKQRLTERKIEKMAVEIREFLLKHGMWQDVNIFFNRKMFSQHDPADDRFYYNDRNHLVEMEDVNPSDYFKYVNPDHILSMSFDGRVYEMIHYGTKPEIMKKFDEIFEKYGVYYQLGDYWNFTCYM